MKESTPYIILSRYGGPFNGYYWTEESFPHARPISYATEDEALMAMTKKKQQDPDWIGYLFQLVPTRELSGFAVEVKA